MHVCLFQSKVLHPTGPLDTSPIAPLDATVCHNRPDHAATEGRKHDPCHPTSHVAIQYLAQVLPELGLRCHRKAWGLLSMASWGLPLAVEGAVGDARMVELLQTVCSLLTSDDEHDSSASEHRLPASISHQCGAGPYSRGSQV